MPIDFSDLKDCAERLATPLACETDLRASISRAYYAAFHRLLPIAESLPRSDKWTDVDFVGHTEMAARLREWKVGSLRPKLARLKTSAAALSHAFNAARAVRIAADYRLGGSIDSADASMQLARVRKMLRIVQQIESEEASSTRA